MRHIQHPVYLLHIHSKPCYILSPGIFRIAGLSKTMRNVDQTYSEPCHRALPQPALDVLGTSPEGPLKVLTSRNSRGTFKGLLGDQQKIDDLIKKKCFLDATAFVLHNYYCLQLEKQIFKSCKWGRPRDVYATSCRASRGPNDGMFWGRSRDVGHICF